MILKNILIITFIFLGFLSCVSVNKLENIGEQDNNNSGTPEQIIVYNKPETPTDEIILELILPEILQPASIILENSEDIEVLNNNNILHKPDIDLLLNTDNTQDKLTEEEVVREYLHQYNSNTNNYSQADTFMQMETDSSIIEEKYSETTTYRNTEVEFSNDYYTEDLSTDMEATSEDSRIFARIGDPITINLENNGWLFLGSDNNEQLNGLKLVSSDQSGGYSNFTFNALELGYYELKFLHQDNIRGIQTTDTIHVTVLTDTEFENKLTNNNTDIGETDFTYAENLMNAGQYAPAVTEFLKNYRESNSYLNDRIAEAYSEMSNHSLAVQYWLKNINTNAEYSEKAVLGIVNSSIAADDYATLLRYVNRLSNISSLSIDEVLIDLTEYYKNKQDYEAAIDTYNQFMTRYSFSRLLDKMYFLMGSLYEENSAYRDFEKAVIFYEMIYENFPESTNSRNARERVDYINRHFFYIR